LHRPACVAYFAALLLNFGDFARFGKDEAAVRRHFGRV
jgi:cytosine/uracil/thiamine/allantoin permease